MDNSGWQKRAQSAEEIGESQRFALDLLCCENETLRRERDSLLAGFAEQDRAYREIRTRLDALAVSYVGDAFRSPRIRC